VVAFVSFSGSRSLPADASAFVRRVVASVVASGRGVAVGCACGLDAVVVRSVGSVVPPELLRVFAVFSASGAGAWGGSAVSSVQAAARAGAAVVWSAGGSGSRRSQLRARSAACVRFSASSGAGAGLVAFVCGGWSASPGSWSTVRLAVQLGLPVVVFPVRPLLPESGSGAAVGCAFGLGPGFSFLPSLAPWCGAGSWVPAARSGLWTSGFRWQPRDV
jgi:hypothetical protein